jgi:predicted AlkP superfamily phosphohydrolase/phosphomutase
VVIGLDGATWDVIAPLGAAGRLPHLWSLATAGARGPLRSTIPPMTFPAFPSLLSGLNPGRHGILGPEAVDLRAYQAQDRQLAVGSGAIAGRTVLDLASAAGRRVLSYGVPMTYPAWPVNGVLVAGYPTPDLFRLFAEPPDAVTDLALRMPERAANRLRGKPLDVAMDEGRDAPPEEIFESAVTEIQNAAENVGTLLSRDAYDLVAFVIRGTDFVNHGLFTYRNPRSPAWDAQTRARYGPLIDRVYEEVDAAVGRLLEQIGDDALVVLASDHGGGPPPTRRFYVTAGLARRGWLAASQAGGARSTRATLGVLRRVPGWPMLKATNLRALSSRGRKRLAGLRAVGSAVDWSRTRAYFVRTYQPGGGIQINLRGRQPHGVVEPGPEYEQLRDEVLAGLRELRDPQTGQPLIQEAHRREDVYRGPHLDRAPDIVFLVEPDYMLEEGPGPLVATMEPAVAQLVRAAHRMHGVFALKGAGVFRTGLELPPVEIVDIAPTLLHAIGLPLPEDLDGRVLEEAFEPGFLRDNPVRRSAGLGDQAADAGEYTPEEEEGIRAALRGLGYIE